MIGNLIQIHREILSDIIVYLGNIGDLILASVQEIAVFQLDLYKTVLEYLSDFLQ